MKWLKEVKKIGDSLGIIFDKNERKLQGIDIGVFLDMSDVIVIKQQNKDGNKKNSCQA